MSLLLDALKKSEAQRRRGKAPAIDLASTPPSGDRRRPGLRWLAVLLVIVVLVLVATAPWLWPQISNLIERRQVADTEAGDPDRDVTERTAPVAATGQPDSDSSPSSGSNQAASPSPTAEPRRAAEPAPVAGAANERLAASTEAGAESRPTDSGSQDTMPADERTDSSTSGHVESGAESAPRRVQQEQQPQPAGAQAQSRQAQELEPESAPEPKPEPEPEPEPRDNFIRPWELPQAQRTEFPDLDLTVHFFSNQPADRFVLINGERYTEGELVEPGTRLAEIRRRGAVVEYGSYRVLIE